MKGFFKTFFAALLALIIFSVLGILILVGFIAAASTSDKPVIGSNAVLVLDLSNVFKEQSIDNPFNAFINKKENDIPSLKDYLDARFI